MSVMKNMNLISSLISGFKKHVEQHVKTFSELHGLGLQIKRSIGDNAEIILNILHESRYFHRTSDKRGY